MTFYRIKMIFPMAGENLFRIFRLTDHLSSWFLYPKGMLTWAELGCRAVQAKINGDEKDRIPVMACVTAAGEKLLLPFIMSGKTMCVEESQIGALTPKAGGRPQKRFKAT
jgi:hypothetical protein